MNGEAAIIVRVLKQLNAAVGYHELGMSDDALACLDRLRRLGNIGVFRPAEEILRAEFLTSRQDYGGAAVALENAARMFPSPQNYGLWLALSVCYWQAGEFAQAINSLACARGVKPAESSHKSATPGS
jgi:tetratricopeptide (TPR) repeat protein